MQLKPKSPPSKAGTARMKLMAASCALLGAGAVRSQDTHMAPADSGLLEDWSVDSALAYYHEDGRIQAIEPVVDVAKVFADGQALNFNVTFDALSGASPNGALTSRTAQTFASPSGKRQHQYTTAPGELPGDPNYHDDRIAAGGNWTVPFTRVDQVSVGGKLSAEDDFYSATVNASIAHDFNERTPRSRSASTTSSTRSARSAARQSRGVTMSWPKSRPEAGRRTGLGHCSA